MSRNNRLALAAVCLLAIAANGRAPANGFALDDEFIIVHNEAVHQIDRIDDIFVSPYWPGTPGRLGLYRPLTTASYALEWSLWGDNPLPFHVTNLLLHTAVTALLFLLLTALLGTPGATAGAAVYAVHPVHVEAVANVVGRAELFAASFVLAAVVIYVRGDLLRSKRRLWGGSVAIGLAYLLGLLSKEIAVTLPGLLLVVEAARRRPGFGTDSGAGAPPPGERGAAGVARESDGVRGYPSRVLARWPVYGAVTVVLVGYLMARAAILGTAVGNDTASYFRALGLAEQWMTAVSLWPEYLRLMVFPYHLVADYSPGVRMPVTDFGPRVVLGLLVGVLAGLAVVWVWTRSRGAAVGILWFCVAVLPVSNLVVPIGVLLAERTLYLPSVGVALVVAGAVGWMWRRHPAWRPPLVGSVALVVALAGARTWTRTPVWRSTATVMESLVEDHPESFRSQWVLADRLRRQGRLEDALALYASAVRLAPVHYQLRMEHGRTFLQAGRYGDAARSFRVARDGIPEHPEAHVFLIVALLEDGRPEQAVAAGRQALEHHPQHRGIHHQMALALARTGDLQGALEARRTSIRLGGERASWRQHLHEAELLLRMRDSDGAAAALARARGRAPALADVPTLSALRSAVASADSAVLPYP